jgi:hypothetical protein
LTDFLAVKLSDTYDVVFKKLPLQLSLFLSVFTVLDFLNSVLGISVLTCYSKALPNFPTLRLTLSLTS